MDKLDKFIKERVGRNQKLFSNEEYNVVEKNINVAKNHTYSRKMSR